MFSHKLQKIYPYQFMKQLLTATPPPKSGSKRIKFYYATQAEIAPPTFIFFLNHRLEIPLPYLRFIERKIRENIFHYNGAAIRMYFKSHRD